MTLMSTYRVLAASVWCSFRLRPPEKDSPTREARLSLTRRTVLGTLRAAKLPPWLFLVNEAYCVPEHLFIAEKPSLAEELAKAWAELNGTRASRSGSARTVGNDDVRTRKKPGRG